MGASGTDERSDREIPNVAAEQGAAECGVAAVAGILETDDPELKNMAANVCIAAANGRPPGYVTRHAVRVEG
jgi:hypothetical protein